MDREKFLPLLAAPAKGPFADAARALSVEVIHVEYGPLRRLDILIRTISRLRSIARERDLSLFHANGPATDIPAAIAARLSGLPVVWHARVLPGPREIDIERLLAPAASLIISNSEAIQRRFSSGGRTDGKAITIINGVDVDRFHPGVPGKEVRDRYSIGPDTLLAGVVGRISPIKGQRTFIEAAVTLLPSRPGLRFLIVGSGLFPGEKEYESELRGFVKELGLEGKIHFTGNQSDVRSSLGALDICVVPSNSEGCSRVLFEAMAMAKSLIATDTGGTPEIVEEERTGILFPPGESQALADALERLASDPDLRRRMGEAGRRRVVKHFTIQKNVQKTEAAYLRLVGGKSGLG